MTRTVLYGVPLERLTPRSAVLRLCRYAKNGKGAVVYTPNIQMLCRARRDSDIAKLLRGADMLLPDGIGVSLLCKCNGLISVGRVAGIDAAHALLKYAAKQGLSVFLLGGERDVARLAKKRLCQEIQGLNICGTHHGYFDKSSSSPKNRAVIMKIRKAAPDIVFVCFGFPMQEAWIKENARALPNVRLFMGLGGSLDVWSGKLRRAPIPFRALGLEWLWRCVREPKRLVRLFRDTL